MNKVEDSRAGFENPGRSRSRAAQRRTLALVFLAAISTACAGDGSRSDSARNAVVVGVSPDYPPVIFESDGEIVGIEADLAHLVGDTLDRPIVFKRYPFPGLIEALERGDVDVIMSGLSITPERSQRVRFTRPYLQVGQLALIRSSDIARFGRIQVIRRRGVRVGYVHGTTGEQFVALELTQSQSFSFEDIDAGVRSLRAGRIDYFVHDAPTIWRLAGDPTNRDLQGLYHPLTEEQLAWAVRPGNESLLALLDSALADWQRKGLIEPIVDRWIPLRVTIPNRAADSN